MVFQCRPARARYAVRQSGLSPLPSRCAIGAGAARGTGAARAGAAVTQSAARRGASAASRGAAHHKQTQRARRSACRRRRLSPGRANGRPRGVSSRRGPGRRLRLPPPLPTGARAPIPREARQPGSLSGAITRWLNRLAETTAREERGRAQARRERDGRQKQLPCQAAAADDPRHTSPAERMTERPTVINTARQG